MQVLLLCTGLLYVAAVRPRLFREREEVRAHIAREVAEHSKYEDEWRRRVEWRAAGWAGWAGRPCRIPKKR